MAFAFERFAVMFTFAFALDEAPIRGLLLVPFVLCAACRAQVDSRSGVPVRSIARSALPPRLALETEEEE